MTTAADRLLEEFEQILETDPDGVGEQLVRGCALTLQRLDEIAADTPDGPGWSMVVDPDRAPAAWLDWQAGLYGVQLVTGSDETARRSRIKSLPPQQRGTIAAMTAAALPTLTGTQTITFTERPSGNAYQLTVTTRTAETPDSAATLKALLSQKPAGIVLTHVIADSPLIDEGTLVIDSVGGTITIDAVATGDV